MTRSHLTLAAVLLLGAASLARADRPPPRQPPPEALAACRGRAAGDACTVQLRDRTIEGTCRTPPRGGTGPLACAPHPPPPPPEAISACDGRAAGDACTVELRDRSIQGTCRTPPPPPDGASRGPLACAPHEPPPHDGGPPPEALTACDGRAAGDACTVRLPDRALDGTCRPAPDGAGPLACVPKDAPPPPHHPE